MEPFEALLSCRRWTSASLTDSGSRFQQPHCLTTLCFWQWRCLLLLLLLLASYLIWFSLWDFIFYHHYIQCKVTEITRSRGSLFTRVVQFSSVQSLSCVWLFATPWTAAHQDSLSITDSWSLFKLMSFESMMPSNYLILCRPLLLLPSIFPSIRVFSNESVLHITWPKYWSFRFSISLSNDYSGLISFRIDWLDLLAVQGTLKRLLQHHSPKASILRRSAFFIVHNWD